MRKNRIAILSAGLAVIALTCSAQGRNAESKDAKQVTCTGKVVDEQGRLIAEAKVSLYQITYDEATYGADSKLMAEARTAPDGAFSFAATPESDGYQYAYIVAEKEGLALGFANWRMNQDQELQVKIELGQAKELAGVVVDEGGRPVSDANVSIWLIAVGEGEKQQTLGRPVAEELLTAATDGSGRFTLTNIPADATADFLVRKAGRATICTYRSTGYAHQKMTFAPGQKDIKMILPIEARIEGILRHKDTGQPASGVRLIVMQEANRPVWGQEPVDPKEDGTFSINALAAGSYTLQLVRPSDGLAEWVAEPVNLTLEAGQTKSGVRIELVKGGLLDVYIAEAETGKPLPRASVSIRDNKNNQYLSARSGRDGIARIRLVPGGYQLSGVHSQGHKSTDPEEVFMIEDGQTKRLEYRLTSQPVIRGLVQDQEGRPVKDAKLKICPMGREDVTSDGEGRFEIAGGPGMWGPEARAKTFCLVARHEQRNLAVAVEIAEDTRELDIRLEPGITFSGKIVDVAGKGIAGAQVRPMLRVSNWGSPLSREQTETDANGNYEIGAMPPGRNYDIYASAKGYGEKDVDAHTDNAVNNRLEIETMTLPLANLSVSGRIVDKQGDPVPDARVEGSGQDQPRPHTLSHAQGNFILAGLCEGTVYIRADVRRAAENLSGRIHTDAGATGIKIVVREGRPVSYYVGTKSYEQIINSNDKIIAGVAVDENGSPVTGVPVGVRCIKRKREDGKFSWTYSSYSTLSDLTDEQGRFAIELEEEAEYNLLFSPDNHAAIIVYDIPAGKKDLEVTLPEGGTVVGRLVRMEDGQKVPIPNVEVKVEQTDRASYTHLGFERDRTAITDAEGRFRFEHLQTKIRSDRLKPEYTPRVWEIKYGDTSKSIAFYEGTMIDELELVVGVAPGEAQPLLGRPMPGFDGVKIDLAPDAGKGKPMLVCFFDMQQRPSRNCITQLAKQAEQLKEKGATVVAVQASTVNENTLIEWVKKNNVSFPVGMIQDNEQQTPSTWGVTSLPWLVLTDREHIVRAEGFGISELEQKMRLIAHGEGTSP